MNFGLRKEIIEKINNVFAEFPEIDEAILYGSRAKGNYKPGSDIDITFIGNDLNNRILNKISLRLDDLLLPYTFDLSLHKHIDNIDLIDHIKRIGKTFYKPVPY